MEQILVNARLILGNWRTDRDYEVPCVYDMNTETIVSIKTDGHVRVGNVPYSLLRLPGGIVKIINNNAVSILLEREYRKIGGV